MKEKKPIIGITMGDPAGIGPEIILKSFLDEKVKNDHLVVIGDYHVMKSMYEKLAIDTFRLQKVDNISQCKFDANCLHILDLELVDIDKLVYGQVDSMCGNAAFQSVKKATELALVGEIDAIATAPLNKEAMHKAGHNYPGHTEILARLSKTEDYAMLLYDEQLRVIHVSTHVSLLQAIQGLKTERIESVIQLAHDTLIKLGYENPRIAVAGLNPHAGENGLFGKEEIEKIIPAIDAKKAQGLNVFGPEPPDTVFLKAKNGHFDIVVVMYHDQGHIPLKLLGFDSGVNVTVGLPIIRTSVDHGTAFEIAWQGNAREESMIASIELAKRLADN